MRALLARKLSALRAAFAAHPAKRYSEAPSEAVTYRWRVRWGDGTVSDWYLAGSHNEPFWQRQPQGIERQDLFAGPIRWSGADEKQS